MLFKKTVRDEFEDENVKMWTIQKQHNQPNDRLAAERRNASFYS